MLKKICFIAPLLVLALTGCNQQLEDGLDLQQPDVTAEGTSIVATIGDATKTALNSSMNVVWSANDQIRLFGSSMPAGAVYKTESDGVRTAIFTPVANDVVDDTRYAVYPASAVEGSKLEGQSINVDFSGLATQPYTASLTAESDIAALPMAAYSTSESFAFKNLCGGIRLQLNNYQMLGISVSQIDVVGNGGEIIAGKAGVNLTSAAVTLSKGESTGATISVKCSDPVQLSTDNNPSAHTDFVIYLPAATYESGLTVKITDTAGRIYTQATQDAFAVEPGIVTPMALIPITLYYGTVNCYRTATAGTIEVDITPYYTLSQQYTYQNKPCLNAQGNYVGQAASAAVVWTQTSSNASGDVLAGTPTIEGNVMKVPVSGTLGNAVVAIKDAQGTVLWSFHIWVGEANDVTYVNTDRGTFQMLDRNLGATSITPKDRNTYGVFYQWGRKDPFLYPLDFTRQTGSPYAYDLNGLISTVDLSAETGNIGYAIQHPATRIMDAANVSWHNEYRNNALWGNIDDATVKTVYDPSPAGYCVPASNCFSHLKMTTKAECDSNYGMNLVVDGTNTSFFPTAGYYDGKTDRLMYGEYRGYLWTSNAGVTGAYRFLYNNASANLNGMNRVLTTAVRCVKIEQ